MTTLVTTSDSRPGAPFVSPIAGPSAGVDGAGVDLAYDPDFERLAAEVEKLTSLSGEAPDWALVAEGASRILTEKSKDLRVLGWFVVARSQLGGWAGLAGALATYLAVARAFWPTLFPPRSRVRARAGQVEWLWGVLAKRVAALPVGVAESTTVRAVEAHVSELAAFFSESLAAADPGVGVLRVALREKVRQLPEVAAQMPATASPVVPIAAETEADDGDPSPPTIPTIPPRELAVATASSPAPKVVPVEAPVLFLPQVDASALGGLSAIHDAAQPLREPMMTLAHHARRGAPASPWPYRTLRSAAWLTVEGAPEAEGAKTPLRGPKAQDRDLLTKLAAASQWEALLEASEDAFATNIFWLDPHRFSALALEGLGPDFRRARAAVAREATTFVARVPGLLQLQFSSGAPFASGETKRWLEAEGERTRGPSVAGNTPSDGETALSRAFEDALTTGPPEEAFASALVSAGALPEARGRFRASLAIAKRAHAAARIGLAHALYERLVAEVDATLEAWEPALSAEALSGLVAVRAAIAEAKPVGARDPAAVESSALFARLLRLDPRAALRATT